ncbi:MULTISPECIES: hypothetical protein [Arthrobacter]|uniref:Uncharacterized protein n=1 Tax=Arthrobacter terricola TaxID=2547396 RepID=A0A4R5KAJ6_9MICC|nr:MULTISPECIES: hypothetical protein [Arthrobacter]MBT8162784.1 hypothetical protein [Arthrobacter sp. GN70]TDF92056.1 hypothetical protein E1809_18930 [Arthrobacter terricola]
MGTHLAIPASTQEKNPRSAVLRTVLAAVIALFPLLNLVLAVVIDQLKPYQVNLPGWVFLWLNGALAVVTVITALATRILAIPGVNDWLRKYAPAFAPEDKITVPTSVASTSAIATGPGSSIQSEAVANTPVNPTPPAADN